MKTAKEITEYIEKENEINISSVQFTIYRPKSNGYYAKFATLEALREFLLKYEYYKGKESQLKGVEEALRWILE